MLVVAMVIVIRDDAISGSDNVDDGRGVGDG